MLRNPVIQPEMYDRAEPSPPPLHDPALKRAKVNRHTVLKSVTDPRPLPLESFEGLLLMSVCAPDVLRPIADDCRSQSDSGCINRARSSTAATPRSSAIVLRTRPSPSAPVTGPAPCRGARQTFAAQIWPIEACAQSNGELLCPSVADIWARALFGVYAEVSAELREDAEPHIVRADGEVLASFVGRKLRARSRGRETP
ncbi:hypothetical protein NHJ13734_008715 [Beauveria thailandica]